MTFVSYAQNQEDVMLYRALRDVKQGFYIDVGAQDPVIDSVTKAFYDRGWHGINVEPNDEYFRKLQSERPHDLNLETVVGREPGVTSFYEVAHTGLSTTNACYARRHSEAGYEVTQREVLSTTLDRICADCGVPTVHFLKIDVEGSERGVLEGFSFEAIRPWVVVVEATEPNTDHEVFAEWEDLLLGRRYRFVYFDGLNRFYVAEEHAYLERHFSRPANPLDQYVNYQLLRARAELDEVRAADRHALVESLNHMLGEVQVAQADAQTLRDEVQAVTAKRDRDLVNLQEAMEDRDQQLGSLKETTAERVRQLAGLQEAIAERDRQLVSLQQAMAERDRRLVSLEEGVAERDRQLFSLEGSLAERDRELVSLRMKLASTQRRVQSVRSSISWKLTSPLREVRRAAFRLIGLFRRSKPFADLATSAFASSDLAACDEIAAGLTEPARLLYRNLRNATALQRYAEEKRISRRGI
jgi:FkbM family methyltransferase